MEIAPPVPLMARKTLERSNELPYHVTLRVNNRELFPLELSRVWKILMDECQHLTWVYGAHFHAVVLMPNHIHMLITVPEFDLGKAMDIFVPALTRALHRQTGRTGRIFGGRYHWSIILGTRYYGHVFKYVYRNPAKARLCKWVEDYPFSTLAGLVGSATAELPLQFTRVGLEANLPWQLGEAAELLPWLNTPFSTEVDRLIGIGLRKTLFHDLKDRSSRKPIALLNELL